MLAPWCRKPSLVQQPWCVVATTPDVDLFLAIPGLSNPGKTQELLQLHGICACMYPEALM